MPDAHPSPDPYALVRALLRVNRELADALEATIPKPAVPAGFVPTDFQKQVLALLKGQGLRVDTIAAKLDCSRSRLYQSPGGLPELVEEGLVEHNRRSGYYRPDAPPAD